MFGNVGAHEAGGEVHNEAVKVGETSGDDAEVHHYSTGEGD